MDLYRQHIQRPIRYRNQSHTPQRKQAMICLLSTDQSRLRIPALRTAPDHALLMDCAPHCIDSHRECGRAGLFSDVA